MSTIHITDDGKIQALKFTEQKDVRDGLVGEWKLDGNLLDSSGNGNNGTFFGGTSPNYVEGRVGKCVEFDGVNDYVDLGTLLPNPLSASFTISFWIKTPRNIAEQIVFSSGNTGSTTQSKFMHLRVYSSGIFRFDFLSDNIETASGVVLVNTWQLITCTYDFSLNVKKIYANGVSVRTGSSKNPFLGTSAMRIGCYRSGVQHFSGLIDEVRLYNRVLTPDEITTLYSTQLPKFTAYSEVITEKFDEVVTDGLVAYYELNGNTKDSAGGNNGIVGSEAGLGISDITFVDGVKNKCANFPYTNKEYIEAEPVQGLGVNGSDITVCCWIKRTGTTLSFVPLIEQGGTRQFKFVFHNSGSFAFGNSNAANAFYRCYYPNILNTWYFLSATVSNNNYTLFVNSDIVPNSQWTNTYGQWVTNKLRIGYRPFTASVGTWKGLIDDVRIYNRALSPQEIKHIYNSTKPEGA